MTVLEVTGLTKAFGGVHAVNGVSFSVAAGELLALVGPNGAGKTTCFNMLNGQIPPDAGEVRLNGTSLRGKSPRHIWRLGVGRTFQITATFGSMTVLENIQMVLLSHHRRLFDFWGRAARRHIAEGMALLERVGMASQADRPCGVLAYGDLKRVELAMALASEPRLLLMDEPTAGMAPRERIELMALTAELVREQNIAVLFTEHDMDVVFTHADRIIVLNRGELIASGTPGRCARRRAAFRRSTWAAAPCSGMAGGLSAMSDAILSVEGLNSFYGRAHILFDVTLEARRGEVVALLGRNGAGKSTTMRSIMGLIANRSGRVTSGAMTFRAGSRTRSPGLASATFRRTGGSSPT